MQKVVVQSLIILLIACALIGCDRMFRIEGFVGERCGVDIPSCKNQPAEKCFNGYCEENRTTLLPRDTGLPVFP
jgi:hypothetical protein